VQDVIAFSPGENSAVLENQSVGENRLYVVKVMGHQNQLWTGAVPAYSVYIAIHGVSGSHIQQRKRLIQYENTGAADEGSGKHYFELLTRGEGAKSSFLKPFTMKKCKLLCNPFAGLERDVGHIAYRTVNTRCDDVSNGDVVPRVPEHPGGYIADAFPQILQVHLSETFTQYAHRAVLWPKITHDNFHECGFSTAVVSHEKPVLPRKGVPVDVVQYSAAPAADGNGPEFNEIFFVIHLCNASRVAFYPLQRRRCSFLYHVTLKYDTVKLQLEREVPEPCMYDSKPRIAIVTFTDDRDVGLYSRDVENRIRDKQSALKTFLESRDIEVIDPLAKMRGKNEMPYGLRNRRDIENALSILGGRHVQGIIIGSWNWSPPMLVMDFVRKASKPLLYYSENDPLAGSLSQMSAACSSLMEWGVNDHALTHDRTFGNREELLSWVRGAAAFSGMRESALLLWGGSYAVQMEQLQDDIPRLKSFMIRDILNEDQLVLVRRAEKIIEGQPERIGDFISWMMRQGLHVQYDGGMVTEESLTKQTALLLAARDRLIELQGENIAGVSIKCQPEIYYEYGVNACTLPAFLPFVHNEQGSHRVYPTVCEGDIKGLLSSVLLHFLNPRVPPAFGDLVSVGDDHVEFANCGAGSLFWAANSMKPDLALKRTRALANIHGVAGAAFSYYGKAADSVTVMRLTRIKGKYFMQLGKGMAYDAEDFLTKLLDKDLERHLAHTWGKVVVNLGVEANNFVKVIGANHLSATLGDVTREAALVCRMWGIPVVRIDSDEEMERFYTDVRYQNRRTS
jgi:L-fucose isomerase-like protein